MKFEGIALKSGEELSNLGKGDILWKKPWSSWENLEVRLSPEDWESACICPQELLKPPGYFERLGDRHRIH